jgi:hypothetical protein
VLLACGDDPASVMAQLGDIDARFTLRVYTDVTRRGTEGCANSIGRLRDGVAKLLAPDLAPGL